MPKLLDLVEKSERYLKQRHFDIEGKPETLTRQFLFEPFLKTFGWSDDPADQFYYVREFSGGMGRKWEDYVLLKEDRPLVFVETKPLFDDRLLSTNNINELLNYMKEFNRKNRSGHRVDWGVLTNFNEIHFFYVSHNKPFFSCKYSEYQENIIVLKELFSVDGIKNVGIDRFFAETSKEEMGDSFLDDLKKWRLILANGLYESNTDLTIDEIKEVSQRILDRLVFVRMLETLGILPYNWLRKIFLRWREGVIGLNQAFSRVLRDNFLTVEDLYDTELFRSDPHDQLKIEDIYLEELMKVQGPAHPRVYKKIGVSGQQTLDDRGIYGYNFKTLTIDVMGSAYERYLAHQITVKKGIVVIKETKKLRKKEGVYYTPPYVVDYIVERTVKPLIEGIFEEASSLINNGRFKEAFSKIQQISLVKILDPACGSGSFLIKVFDVIAQFYNRYNELFNDAYRKRLRKNGLLTSAFGDNLKIKSIGERILLENIHGIDLDPQAVEITKLNLWIKMLSLDPASYRPTIGKRQKKLLPSLVTNIKQGNSLFSGFEKIPHLDRSELEQVAELRQRLKEQILRMGPKTERKNHDQLKVEFERLLIREKKIRFGLASIANENLGETFDLEEGGLVGLNGQPFNWEIEFPEVFLRENEGFDVILGNPPHGAELSQQERSYIEQNYDTGKGYKNTAFFFVERSLSKLRSGQKIGLVIPKSLTFAQKWGKVRDFLLDIFSLEEIVDISKAFKGVLLEQVVIIVSKSHGHADSFRSGYLDVASKDKLEFNEIPFDFCRETDAFPMYADEKSRAIYHKMKRVSVPLGDISRTFRGFPLQSKLREEKGTQDEEILMGADIRRYSFQTPRKFLPATLIKNEKADLLRSVKIISQRIVAHVTRPVDHILLMSTLDNDGLINVDTVENTIIDDTNYSPKHVLALINSRLIGWFAYIFIFNKAIRTMDFDDYYVGKIFVPRTLCKLEDTLSRNVDTMLVLCRQKHYLISMFKNLLANLNMTRKEKLSFYYSSPRIAELHGISLSGTSRIGSDETGIVTKYYVKLDGDSVVISVDTKEQEATLEITRLKFDDPVMSAFFYTILKEYDGVKTYKKSRKLYDTTVANMLVPRNTKSNLVEDNPEAISQTMDTLQKEFEKIKHEFFGSPVLTANLAETEQKITEIDNAIDEKIFQIYGLSKDDVTFVKERTPTLTRAT